MLGLTEPGLREKIRNFRMQLSQDEAVDLFFIYPTLVDLTWKDDKVKTAKVNGLNLEFTVE